MLDEQTSVLARVTQTLERLEVPYFVAGSFASNVHGFYLQHWAGELRLTDLLQRALEESGLA